VLFANENIAEEEQVRNFMMNVCYENPTFKKRVKKKN